MKPSLLACLALLLSSSLACAAQVPLPDAGDIDAGMDPAEAARLQAAQDAMAAWYARAATELAASGEARDLALAATMLDMARWNPPVGVPPDDDAPSQPVPRDPRATQWRQLASARAGSDVLANVLLVAGGAPADATQRAQALDRWRRLEPDNLAPRLFDAGGVKDWLPAVGAHARLDLHYYAQLRALQAALAAHSPRAGERALVAGDMTADETAALTAAGIMAAVAMPALQPLAEACTGDALDGAPTRRGDCRHVAEVAAQTSDTSIVRSIGIRLLQATAATPAQQADAQARRQRLDWQMLQWGRIAGGQPDDGAAQFVRLLRDPAIQTEQDLVERVLAEADVPLDPPAGWQPPRR